MLELKGSGEADCRLLGGGVIDIARPRGEDAGEDGDAAGDEYSSDGLVAPFARLGPTSKPGLEISSSDDGAASTSRRRDMIKVGSEFVVVAD